MCGHQEIEHRLQHALGQVYETDRLLIELEVHERTVAARLAMYLQDAFADWDVDCEYNRDARHPKKILDRLVYPDVIIHRRNTTENLLAIEMKGHWSKGDRRADYQKLIHLTGPAFGYEFGAHVELNETTTRIRWFADASFLEAAQ